jgi:uncharacterized membrane protein
VPPGTPRRLPWLKIALVLSVALNLGVLGLALGAWTKHGPDRRATPRDLSFGPFAEALTPEDRRALRTAFRERMPGQRADREAARTEFAALVSALRAEPFGPADLQGALSAIEARLTGRVALGSALIEERLLAMTPAERAAFADRLERGLGRGPGD